MVVATSEHDNVIGVVLVMKPLLGLAVGAGMVSEPAENGTTRAGDVVGESQACVDPIESK